MDKIATVTNDEREKFRYALARADCFTLVVNTKKNIFRESFALLIVTNIIDNFRELIIYNGKGEILVARQARGANKKYPSPHGD